MLYYLYQYFYSPFDAFRFTRVLNSITIRAMIAFLLSFLIVIFIGKPFINYLRKKKVGEEIRELGPQTHQSKKGTPTMGGVMIVFSILFTTLIAGNLSNKFIILLIITTILFGIIGFVDDYWKWSEKNKKGMSPKMKIAGQIIIGAIVWVFIWKFGLVEQMREIDYSLVNPFVKNSFIYIGAPLFLLFTILLITGTSNAVNITDGLDGLVIVPVIIVSIILGIITYFAGHVGFSNYLNMYYIKESGEILVFLTAVIGSGLGFLWYNFYPAQIFMGDTGSLTLGGIIGVISIILKQELLLPIIGFVFVMEALSVMIQVGSFKMRQKRVFKMAPIHHHFELQGLPETKVTMRFWITAIMFGLIGLIILKLR